jgi:hypothetical protein
MRRPLSLLLLLLSLLATMGVTQGVTQPGSAAVASAPATQVVYVRPVTVSGRPAPGWSVTRLSGTVSCLGTAPSAVNPGITSCYPTAYALRACWKSRNHTVLCVRDARVAELVRVRYTGRYPRVEGPAEPQPLDLVLSDGRTCLLRTGGAWGSPAQHPQWIGYDSCTRNASVYGPGAPADGINRSHPRWTVRLWRTGADPEGRHLVTRGVVSAYVVGTAAD